MSDSHPSGAVMAALAEWERREVRELPTLCGAPSRTLPMIMAPRMANDPSPTIVDLAMDEEPRRKPPVIYDDPSQPWPPPTWQQTAENLREALALTTAERDDARQDRDANAQELASALCSIRRFEKLFADAGQGEHNVLALVDHYAAEAEAGQEAQHAVRALRDLVDELRGLFRASDSAAPSSILGEVARLLGVRDENESEVETVDLTLDDGRDLGDEHAEIGGES